MTTWKYKKNPVPKIVDQLEKFIREHRYEFGTNIDITFRELLIELEYSAEGILISFNEAHISTLLLEIIDCIKKRINEIAEEKET